MTEDSKKDPKKRRYTLFQLILFSLLEVFVSLNVYNLHSKMDEVTKPLIASYILLFVMLCLLCFQWFNWIKSNKEYRKGVNE